MSDKFAFDEDFLPVPPAAVDADPAATIRDLLYRVGRLEQSLDDQYVEAVADLKAVLLDLLALSDDISTIVERWGVTTNAQEAAIIRSVVALGRKTLATVKRNQAVAIATIGELLDPETSDVVGTEVRENMPANTVLREVRIGYAWPHGLLRRAAVVVSGKPESPAEENESEGPAEEPPDDLSGDAAAIGDGDSV